ncbi:hypothetical protein GPECTOR_15g383 [Gonium pectorale]|uniref:Uncharacterized protein n=1 Tax=Gonium pectorale TaxID=33097 RepID=A0A150GLG8_GONPE|nr:hypothetical protein GPECTOR_15g383 [Gonium pectorale]|eukprot:KXZ50699.1 hypothetical protein GPECTOR_15g383 [Gonium pectorale]
MAARMTPAEVAAVQAAAAMMQRGQDPTAAGVPPQAAAVAVEAAEADRRALAQAAAPLAMTPPAVTPSAPTAAVSDMIDRFGAPAPDAARVPVGQPIAGTGAGLGPATVSGGGEAAGAGGAGDSTPGGQGAAPMDTD